MKCKESVMCHDGESSEILWNEEIRTRVVKRAENVKQGCDGEWIQNKKRWRRIFRNIMEC
jgi:hypothetical protein